MNFPSKYNYQCLKSKCQTHNDQPEAVQSNDPSPARNERLKIHYCQKPISPIRVFDPMRPIKRNKAKSNKIKHSQWVHQQTNPYDLLNYTNTTTFIKLQFYSYKMWEGLLSRTDILQSTTQYLWGCELLGFALIYLILKTLR